MKHTGSKTQCLAEYDAPATTPAPPTKPQAILSIILPYKLGATITSNCRAGGKKEIGSISNYDKKKMNNRDFGSGQHILDVDSKQVA